jgi:hypothetical protein
MLAWYSNKVPQLITLTSIGASNLGYITVAQAQKDVPFNIQRVYWTYFTPHNVQRGNHAHKKLEQIIVAVAGTIDFEIENHKGERFNFKLDNPETALYIPELCWRAIRFSHNAVLLCMASLDFEKEEYIRDYSEFKKYCS